MKRNESIEVFRCLLMFGIVLLHCVSQGPIVLMLPYHLLMACVTGFVFISGYFGIRFMWRKVLSLVMTCLACNAFVDVAFRLYVLHQGMPMAEMLRCIVSGSWFVWAYLVLMAFAPVIERAVCNIVPGKDGATWAIPLLVVVFGWSHCCGLPIIGRYLPHPAGFGTHTFLMMVGVYLAARLCRVYDVESWFGWRSLSVLIVVSGSLCAVGFSHYNSPVSFVFMAGLFYAFKRIRLGVIGKIATVMGPSMLSVYLIHWSTMGITILNQMEGGGGGFCRALFTALVLFIISIVLDVPRRFLWYICGRISGSFRSHRKE